MNFSALLLSILILLLSVQPCSDGENIEDQLKTETGVDHNHQEDSDDACPITCICNCCGISVLYEPIKTHNLELTDKISTRIISSFQSIYRFDFHFIIWQPPKMNS